MKKLPHEATLDEVVSLVKKDILDVGAIGMLNINKEEDISINGNTGKKFTYSILTEIISVNYFASRNYIISLNHNYGLNSKDESDVQLMLNTLKIKQASNSLSVAQSYTHSFPQFSIAAKNGWKILQLNDKENPLKLYNTKYPDAYISVSIDKLDDDLKSFNNEEYLDYLKNLFESMKTIGASLDIDIEIHATDAHAKLNAQLTDSILFDASMLKKAPAKL